MEYEKTREVLGASALQCVDFDGIEVTVMTARMLHRMKGSTVCPQGHADTYRLAGHFGFEDE